eukprot:489346-Rhodomonas_salina.2
MHRAPGSASAGEVGITVRVTHDVRTLNKHHFHHLRPRDPLREVTGERLTESVVSLRVRCSLLANRLPLRRQAHALACQQGCFEIGSSFVGSVICSDRRSDCQGSVRRPLKLRRAVSVWGPDGTSCPLELQGSRRIGWEQQRPERPSVRVLALVQPFLDAELAGSCSVDAHAARFALRHPRVSRRACQFHRSPRKIRDELEEAKAKALLHARNVLGSETKQVLCVTPRVSVPLGDVQVLVLFRSRMGSEGLEGRVSPSGGDNAHADRHSGVLLRRGIEHHQGFNARDGCRAVGR